MTENAVLNHFGTKNEQICQSKPWELSKNGQLFFWKNLHFDDVITDDVIMLFWGVKRLKILFFNHCGTKNGQICQSKSWELSKNHQLFFWKKFHFDDVITDDVIMLFWGVKWLKMLFFNRFRAKNGDIWKSNPWELSKSGQFFLSRFSKKNISEILRFRGLPPITPKNQLHRRRSSDRSNERLFYAEKKS